MALTISPRSTCSCGHDRYHHAVRPEFTHGPLAWLAFFTGVSAVACRVLEPEAEAALRVRLSILMLVLVMVVPIYIAGWIFIPDERRY